MTCYATYMPTADLLMCVCVGIRYDSRSSEGSIVKCLLTSHHRPVSSVDWSPTNGHQVCRRYQCSKHASPLAELSFSLFALRGWNVLLIHTWVYGVCVAGIRLP